MTNVIEQLRQKRGLTYAAIGRKCGLTKTAVLRHCKGERKIGGESALRYHVHLGIPIKSLRPDLYVQSETVADNAL